MKKRNKNKINIDIEENNYSIYRNLLDEYTDLKENKHIKFNLERNVYMLSIVCFIITIAAIFNLYIPLNMSNSIFFIIAGAAFLNTGIRVLTNENRVKDELSKRHLNLVTDVDYLEMMKKLHQYEWSKQIRRTKEDIVSRMDEKTRAKYEDLVENFLMKKRLN